MINRFHFFKLIAIVIILLGTSAQAQFRMGLKGGLNISTVIQNMNEFSDYELEYNTGYQVGPVFEMGFSESFGLEIDVLLSQKGYKEHVRINDATYQVTHDPLYVEVPLMPVFKAPFESADVLFGIGPFVAYGFSGKTRIKGSNYSHTKDIFSTYQPTGLPVDVDALIVNSGLDKLNPLDMGLQVMFGIDFFNVQLLGSYKKSIFNHTSTTLDGISLYNDVYTLSVCYLFNTKKQKKSYVVW